MVSVPKGWPQFPRDGLSSQGMAPNQTEGLLTYSKTLAQSPYYVWPLEAESLNGTHI